MLHLRPFSTYEMCKFRSLATLARRRCDTKRSRGGHLKLKNAVAWAGASRLDLDRWRADAAMSGFALAHSPRRWWRGCWLRRWSRQRRATPRCGRRCRWPWAPRRGWGRRRSGPWPPRRCRRRGAAWAPGHAPAPRCWPSCRSCCWCGRRLALVVAAALVALVVAAAAAVHVASAPRATLVSQLLVVRTPFFHPHAARSAPGLRGLSP